MTTRSLSLRRGMDISELVFYFVFLLFSIALLHLEEMATGVGYGIILRPNGMERTVEYPDGYPLSEYLYIPLVEH